MAISGGLICPRCECPQSEIYKVRKSTHSITRYRKCDHCGARWMTRQPIEEFKSVVNPRPKKP